MGAACSKCTDCFGGHSDNRRTPPAQEPLLSLRSSQAAPVKPSNSAPHASVELEASEFDSQQILMQCEEATANFLGLLESFDESRFEVNYDKEDCRVLTVDTPRSFLMWAVFNMPCSAEAFIRTIKHIDRRAEWDANLQAVRTVCCVDESTFVSHQTYRKVLTAKARDLLVVSSFSTHNGAWLEVSQSVQSEYYPEQPDCVRATLFLGGNLVEALGTDVCRVTCLSETDLGSTLPRMIVKKLTALAFPKYVRSLKRAIVTS
jgi:hypothetical protein